MATLIYIDADGEHTVEGVLLEQGIVIDKIDKETEWNLHTYDTTPRTTVTPHVGGRPNDRA